ncbi:MAG TPA: OmpH family outer membrane protein [Cytophagaceae bacterium]|jgi:outer membrane protein
MMVKLHLAINVFFLIAIGFLLYKAFGDGKRVVYIDTTRIIGEYKGMASARKQIEVESKGVKANLDSLSTSFQAEMKAYEMTRATMSGAEAKKSEEQLRVKQQQYMQYQDAVQKKVEASTQKVNAKVIKEIDSFIKKFGEKKGYDMILGANATGNVVFSKPQFDVTDEVLEELNKSYSGK